jgi:hypothetical protein
MEVLYLSRASLATALNPVPGNQSGRCRTVQGFVNYSQVILYGTQRHARIGKASTRNFPGTIADVNACVASMFAVRNGSSIDFTSIP